MTTNKVFIKTHGCQMNEYDSSRMLDLLKESHGYELTDQKSEADLLLLNTCSIREKAQEKVFHQLGRLEVVPVLVRSGQRGPLIVGRARRFSFLPPQRLDPLVRQVVAVVLQRERRAVRERAEPSGHVVQVRFFSHSAHRSSRDGSGHHPRVRARWSEP